jgi:carboxypeptidase Taq
VTAAYQELERRFAHLAALEKAQEMLHWDRETIMPSGGAAARGQQLAALGLVVHEKMVEPGLSDLLDEAEERALQDPWQAANLALMRREWRHANALDADLVEASSRATSKAVESWLEARPAADFAGFLPAFREVVHLTCEIAQAKAEAFGVTPYDALLERFEPSITGDEIDALFGRLAEVLPGLRDRILERQASRPEPRLPDGPFPAERQKALGERLMTLAGFDTNRGRLDVSAHPFTAGAPGDIRITTRFDEADFTSSVMAVMHETGHGLYEQGLPGDWQFQPVGSAANMTVHESQSLLIEMQASRTQEFLSHAAALMRDVLGGEGEAWQAGNLHRLAIHVAPGFIRVDADEVHYPLHIMLRTRMERDLISGDLDAADVPEVWNAGMAELVGITPADDGLGCLQDIHWASGLFGYFPTYSLGALAAAQLFRAAREQVPEIMPGLENGDFSPLLGWLRENVHAKGALLSTQELLTQATGAPLGTEVFEAHLQQRYLD